MCGCRHEPLDSHSTWGSSLSWVRCPMWLGTEHVGPCLPWQSAKRRSRPRWPKTMAVMNIAWSLAETICRSQAETNHGLETIYVVSSWDRPLSQGRDHRMVSRLIFGPCPSHHCDHYYLALYFPSLMSVNLSSEHTKLLLLCGSTVQEDYNNKKNYNKSLYPKIGFSILI